MGRVPLFFSKTIQARHKEGRTTLGGTPFEAKRVAFLILYVPEVNRMCSRSSGVDCCFRRRKRVPSEKPIRGPGPTCERLDSVESTTAVAFGKVSLIYIY
jgi:hypothetical protein